MKNLAQWCSFQSTFHLSDVTFLIHPSYVQVRSFDIPHFVGSSASFLSFFKWGYVMKWWSLQLRVDRSNFSNPDKIILQIHQPWTVVLRSSASTHASGFGDDLSPSVGMIDQDVGLPFQCCHSTVVDNHDFGLIFFIVRSSWPCAFLRWFDCHMKYILYQILWSFISMILSRSRAFLPHGDYGQVGRWSCLNLNVHLEGCLMFSLCNGTVMNWTHW